MSASSLRRGDVLHVLPDLPRRAVLLDAGEGWRDALERSGCAVVSGGQACDLVVTSRAGLPRALAQQAPLVLVEGAVRQRDAGGLHRTAWTLAVRRPLPQALAPSDERALVRRAAAAWDPADAVGLALRRLLEAGVPLPLPQVTVLAPSRAVPRAVRLAEELGAPAGCRPVLLVGGGSARRRVGALLHPPGARRPRLLVKTGRYGDEPARAEVEQAAAGRAAQARVPGVRVPQVLAVSAAGSLEEVADGPTLRSLLLQRSPAARTVLPTLGQWLVGLSAHTARPDGGAAARCGDVVLPLWPELAPALGRALDRVGACPAVLAHGDLVDGGNVVVTEDGPAVVDWETADDRALPLLDLLPLLLHSSAVLAAGTDPVRVAEHVLETAAGRTPASTQVLAATRAALAGLHLPAELGGPLALLAWARAGGQPREHRAQLLRAGLPPDPGTAAVELVAQRWTTHPGLGEAWPALDP